MRKTIVFGLKGVLVDSTHTSAVGARADLRSEVVGTRKVWVRPRASELLLSLAAKEFDIAIWSTANRRNTASMVKVLPDVPWKFVWTREHTDNDDFRRIHAVEDEDSWATQRSLGPILRTLGIERDRLILVDDCASKCRLDADRLIVIPTFEVTKMNAAHDQTLDDLQLALNNADELMLPAFL